MMVWLALGCVCSSYLAHVARLCSFVVNFWQRQAQSLILELIIEYNISYYDMLMVNLTRKS